MLSGVSYDSKSSSSAAPSSRLVFCDARSLSLSATFLLTLRLLLLYELEFVEDGLSGERRRAVDVEGEFLCFASQTRSIQTQIDLITNVTVERFIRLLNGDNAADFSKIIDFVLSGYGRLEIDSNTLFVNFIMEKKFDFREKFVKPEIIPFVCFLAAIKHVF